MNHTDEDAQLRRRGCDGFLTTNGLATKACAPHLKTSESSNIPNPNGQLNGSLMTLPATKKSTTLSDSETVFFNRSTAKRSLSESSADEFHKSGLTASNKQRNMWRNELIVNSGSAMAQPQVKFNGRTGRRGSNYSSKHVLSDLVDIVIRVVSVLLFAKLEVMHAFQRIIQPEELWLYKNPRTPDIVSPRMLLGSVILGPFITTILSLLLTRDRRDFRAANWTWTLALCVNGLATSLLKITVGRPRPDFYYRCFPDGVMVMNNFTDVAHKGAMNLMNCTGSFKDINEGFKSFPSGHASFAFTGFGFISFYIAGKLHAFSIRGHGQTWRLYASLTPLMLAAMIAVSRTCDYHHHYQDVIVGSIIGFFSTYLVYRQYYPSIFSPYSGRAFPRGGHNYTIHTRSSFKQTMAGGAGDADALRFTNDDGDFSDDILDAGSKDERRPLIYDSDK